MNLLAREEQFPSVSSEESDRQVNVRWMDGGPCDTMALSLARRLCNCFKWLLISVHDELLQASAQNLSELFFCVEESLTSYQIPLH